MATTAFELLAKIVLDYKDFESGLKDASGKLGTFGSKLTSGLATAAKVGAAGLSAATGAVTAFGGAAVKAGMDFDASMSNVAAISGATGADFEALRNKAQEMGSTTKFSASEAADAMGYMAMAGWKTEDMLSGIEGIMNLAAASGEDLATTSDIVTDALTAFGLSAEDSGHFADVLAAASSNANTNVSMLGESFKYVAPVAGALGYSAEDTSIALGLMANSGIKASQAGTALRTLMTNLAKPTDTVQAAMTQLGISLTDDQGNMKSLMDVMGDLRQGFGSLSESQQAELAASLAGKEGMSGLLAIVNASDADFDKLTGAIYDSTGAAEKMADVMQDNLAGDITIFKSALEGAQIAISDGLSPAIREFVQSGTEALSRLTIAFKEEGLPGAIEVFSQIVEEGANRIAEGLPKLLETGAQILIAVGKGIIRALPKLAETAIELLKQFANYIMNHSGEMGSAAGDLIVKLGKFIIKHLPDLAEIAVKLVAGLAMFIISAAAELIRAGAELIAKLVKGIGDKIKDVKDKAAETVKGFIEKIKEFFRDLVTLGGDIVLKIASGIGKKISNAVTKAKELGDKIKESFTGAVTKAKEWGSNIVLNIKGGIESVASKLTTGVTNLATSIGKVWETLVKNGETFGINFLVNFINGIAKTVSKLSDVIKQIANAIYDGIKALIDRAVTWGKDLINNFVHGIEQAISNLVSAAKDAASKVADFLGFSEPKEGPLSKFHTFAPDMMELFAKGIKDNENVVTNQIAKSFDFGQKGVAFGGANLTDMVASIANRPAGPRQMTVILELDKAQLGRAVYTLNNEETQRVGLKLAGGLA